MLTAPPPSVGSSPIPRLPTGLEAFRAGADSRLHETLGAHTMVANGIAGAWNTEHHWDGDFAQ